ncbi:RING-type domain-containing protein [Plasmodiophora brassicae]|nr:hypothetical protein PBRA_003613 [Plasmodiophora brassicae]
MQSEIDALPPEIARLSAENDKLAKDEIERLAQVEDENEKSAAQEIAAVKQRLVDSRDALAALIKKTTRQKQYNDKLRSKLSSVEMKCRMARDALERDRQSETARQQRLEAKFAEQRLALAGVFRRIMDSVESCRRVTDGLHTGLTCSVCFNEFDDPYVFSPCGHTSCQVCIPADRFCPVCAHEDGAPLTTTCMKNDLLARIIEQHKWFIEPMMEAGDAIRAVCTQVLSGKPPSTS